MIDIDLLIEARWIIPIEPPERVLEQHALAVNDGRIVALLPAEEARRRYRPKSTEVLAGHALIPGLVNAHTHLAMSLLRGYADDQPLQTWLNDWIWPAEGKFVSHDFVRAGTELALAESIAGGTTCFSDMYFFADATVDVAERCGMRGQIGLVIIDFPSAWAQSPNEYFAKAEELAERVADLPLVGAAAAPHSVYAVSPENLSRSGELARRHGLKMHIHLQENAAEVEDHVRATGRRPLQTLERLGLLDENLIAVHMTQLLQSEIEAVAEAGASVVHCPESNLKLASGICPIQQLRQAGVRLALGTDGAASNNDLDMLAEARTAALVGKYISADAAAVNASTILGMATIGGARTLGLEDEIGSLEVGKAADLAAVNLTAPSLQPVYNPISQLVYAASRDHVSDVWVAGRPLMRDGTLTTLDCDRVLAEAHTWGEKIWAGRPRQGLPAGTRDR